MKKLFLTTIFTISSLFMLFAQTEHRGLIQGNSFFQKKDFERASQEYEKVLQVNANSVKGQYNLGNTRYGKQEFDKAIENYKIAAERSDDENVKAKAYHNLGNAYVKKEKFEDAVNAYKNALRLKPDDIDTKYNLAQTMRMIQRNQPPPPQQDNKNENENKPPPEDTPKDEIDRMMDMMDNEDKKTQENKKNPSSRKRKPEKDW